MVIQKIDAIEGDEQHVPESQSRFRGPSRLGTSGSSPFNKRSLILAFGIGAAGILGTFAYSSWKHKNLEQAEPEKVKVIKNHLPPLNLTPPAPDPVPTPQPQMIIPDPSPSPVQDRPLRTRLSKATKKPAPSPAELLRQRRLSAPLSESHTSGSHQQTASHDAPVQVATSKEETRTTSELQDKMKPLRLNPSQAGTLGDRNYLLTQGAMIDCVLETRMITTQPGMTTCYVTRDIYSTNGQVILIDRGSKIVGHYQGGLTQGQARIFVLWSRIETPQGVIINLDSPGTGPLGEGGVDGEIDTHFWERFGGAIMLSLIDDFAQGSVGAMNKNKGGKSQSNQLTFSNTTGAAQDMASEALKNSINIPPTLYKNQGDRINIFVARDLDFRGVYDLRAE